MNAQMRKVSGFVAGEWLTSAEGATSLTDKYNGHVLAEVATSDRASVDKAVQALVDAQDSSKTTPRQRADFLSLAAQLVKQRKTELVQLVQWDTGFALADAEKEVIRTAETLQLCAEEAKRFTGHIVPVEGSPAGAGKFSYTKKEPVGVVCALTPFNSPLNTVAHKVGPALAAGNSVILKPATLTPLTAAAFVEILLQAGVPPMMLALVYGSGSQMGSWLTENQDIDYYAFTGSTNVGKSLHERVGMRRTQLEMGSLSSTIICADADLADAADAIVAGTLRKSGQVCTSVQRIYADKNIVGDLTRLLVERMKHETPGNPYDSATTVGPLISPVEAQRVNKWIHDAVHDGANLAHGGGLEGNVVEPTLLTDVPADATIMTNELFGPAALIKSFEDLNEAFLGVNSTPYGLAAGIFTRDLATTFEAVEKLHVGSVYVNQTSSSRVDTMPFAGHKLSGFGGAEGPAYAIHDMSQEKTITVRTT